MGLLLSRSVSDEPARLQSRKRALAYEWPAIILVALDCLSHVLPNSEGGARYLHGVWSCQDSGLTGDFEVFVKGQSPICLGITSP